MSPSEGGAICHSLVNIMSAARQETQVLQKRLHVLNIKYSVLLEKYFFGFFIISWLLSDYSRGLQQGYNICLPNQKNSEGTLYKTRHCSVTTELSRAQCRVLLPDGHQQTAPQQQQPSPQNNQIVVNHFQAGTQQTSKTKPNPTDHPATRDNPPPPPPPGTITKASPRAIAPYGRNGPRAPYTVEASQHNNPYTSSQQAH
jgi:hypothetical protein